MKYIRTKDGIYEVEKKERAYFEGQPWLYYCKGKSSLVEEKEVINQADTVEELIQLNDIVFYWQQSDDKERCTLMIYPDEIRAMRFNAITKLLIPIGDDYKCVAKADPSFELINRRRYLVQKGVLKLL